MFFCTFKNLFIFLYAHAVDIEKFGHVYQPEDVINKGKVSFEDRLNKINWKTYYNSWPFNESALALYEWAPIADELKTLDRKIVLNSMILKWDNIKEEFKKLIKI